MITDLTKGSCRKTLWAFSIPMLLSVVFQQLYNIVDSVIAGRFIGENALAAVGASYPITMIFMSIAVGSNIGCAVVVSQLFGSQHFGKLKTAVCTIFVAAAVLSLSLTVVGVWQGQNLLRLILTPENIFSDAYTYLRIYIYGFFFLFNYNVCTGIFTSLGDSKTPLYLLIGSSLGNIFLDILFVAVFHMGVAGVAWATLVAQGIAAVLAFILMLRHLKELRTTEPFTIFSGSMLVQVAIVAIPSILQQCFVSVGNMFIQSLVNSFGSAVIAGYSAAIKLNTFTVTSITTLSNGLSSFTAQNLGARKIDRVQEGFKWGTALGLIVCIPFVIYYFIFSNSAIGLFMNAEESKEAIAAGVAFLRIVTPFYCVVTVKLMCDSVLRGSSAMLYFMATTFTDLVLRVVLAFVFAKGLGFGSIGIWMSWPFGWGISTLLSFFFYHRKPWEKTKLCVDNM